MRKVFIALLATAALLSCNRTEMASVVSENDLDVRFSTNLQTFTVKAGDALDGKQVRIFAGAPISATTLATAAENKLTPETTLRWVKNQTSKTNFASIYPAEISENASFEYDLLYEGAQNFDYHVAVLAASAPEVEPGATVNLTYKHPFALFQIKLVNQVELADDAPAPTVEMSGVVAKAAFDLLAGTVQLADETVVIPATLKDGLYQLVIMPQTATPQLKVKVGDKIFKFAAKDAIEFAAGKRYSAEITAMEGAEAAIEYDVDDWGEEDPVPFDELNETWKVLGLGGKWSWADGIAMTKGDGVWEADITYAAGEEFKLSNGETWCGMKAGWDYYGTGIFEGDQNYLDATNAANNIKFEGAGEYHLEFTWPSCKFVVTKTSVDPEPEALIWKVVGMGPGEGDAKWDWAGGIAMTCTTPGENNGEGVWEADITYAATDRFKLRIGTAEAGGNVWAGMKVYWNYYGVGTTGIDDPYLDLDVNSKNVVIGSDDGVAGEYHLQFTYPSCAFVITSVGGGEPDPQPQTPALTVYVKAEWNDVYFYSWVGDTKLSGEWPGTKLTATETIDEVVYKKIEFANLTAPATIGYIVSNGGSGWGNQTADQSYQFAEAGAKLFVKVNADASIAE